MLRIRTILFAALAVFCLTRISYGAVRLITETENGHSVMSTPLPSANESGCGEPTCLSEYGCELSGAVSGYACEDVSCCDSAGNLVNQKECPSAFKFGFNDSGIGNIPGGAWGDRYPACRGTQKGKKDIWMLDDPALCETQGITDTTYLGIIGQGKTCGSHAGAQKYQCERPSDGAVVDYCLLPENTAFLDNCPTNYVGYPREEKCVAGDGSTEIDSVPCKVSCGNNAWCLAYTCSLDSLTDCNELKKTKSDEGYTYYSGPSDAYDSSRYPYLCKLDDAAKYVGFGRQNDKEECQGTFESDSESVCTDLGGEAIDSCTYYPAEKETKKYRCGCGDGYQTLKEYCSKEYKGSGDCLSEVYGDGTACTADKDDDGNPLYKYKSFKKKGDTGYVDLCESFNQEWLTSKPEGGSCKTDTTSGSAKAQSCREVNETTYETTITAICLYCQGWKAEKEATEQCVPGKPKVCAVPGDEKPKTFVGCSCNTDEGWQSIGEYCEAAGNAIENCMSTVKGDEAEGVCYETFKNNRKDEDIPRYKKFTCGEDYKTLEEWCNVPGREIAFGYECLKDYIGLGSPCKIENPDDSKLWKYRSFGLKCPTGAEGAVYVKGTLGECMVEGDTASEPAAEKCYGYDPEGGSADSSKVGYICKCPKNYGSECENSYEIRGGNKCEYDRDINGTVIVKYEKCGLSCGGEYAPTHSVNAYDCEDIDNYSASVRGGLATPEMCMMPSERSEHYICACPNNFQTLEDWCEDNWEKEGLSSVNECTGSYTGRGTACRRDVEKDSQGNPGRTLTKYAYYVRYCPTDRPLYYSEEDCRFIGGDYEFSCLDTQGNERVVCQCPLSYFPADSSEGEEGACVVQSLGGTDYAAEASGSYCDFDGQDNLKYQECIAKCSSILNDTNVAVPNAYMYLSAEDRTPTQTMCTNQMGNGAVLGYGDQAFCSLNHSKMYPCYCPASFRECLAEDNEMAADNALVCKINDKVYYSSCVPASCGEEGPAVAVVDMSVNVDTTFGPGAEVKICTKDGKQMQEVSCNTSTYSDPCDYPYEAPKEGSWCKYNTGSGKMADGRKHYMAGACKIKKELGECGASIVEGDDTVTGYTIFVASTESECKSKYGPGISTQLCEYGEDQGYKRAYNCYYDPDEFKYTTANCGVRHDLTGNYIIVNGQKRWKECNCASAYSHHKYNCGGLLSGNSCKQEITDSLARSDSSLREAVDEGYLKIGSTLPFYPYCECSADYTEICDEDGSGRYKGVGQACNGKYKSCECVPDPLPDNWADNYYGCPGGKKPTGVWKDNGCGRKYYQCSVVECTWEYTEMCEAPQIPVGQSCQDNQGNIGGYKACTCPADYQVCPAGQVGKGEPCNLKGVSYYKECESQEACTSLATETCTGPLQIGVNPCTRDGVTYYESCVCANGYTEACGEGMVGVGSYCELDGTRYYKECAVPEDNKCTEGHVTACDTNQESYSPCVDTGEDGKQVVKYLCKCPSNWKACSSGSGEKCIQKNSDGSSTTYWSECNSTAEPCSPYQELTYKVCTAAQTGDGGSCTSTTEGDGETAGTTVVKYAQCKDTDNCLTNGFKYSCSGYDPSILGEYCVDANGNRLYKECPCPSNYITCNNPNASRGSKCTPLKADGSFGTTVYSSCECDRSKYKYTCEEEGNNKGITTPKTQNYCEVTETVTETVPGEDGETITQEVEKKIKYYTSCDCKEEYKYTCSNAEHGEVIPNDYRNDYCLINSSRFYKGCDCSSDYNTPESDCGSGQIADMTRGSCTIKGLVPAGSSGSKDDEEEGGGTVSYKENQTLYTGCICKPNFILKCDLDQYEQGGIESCKDSQGATVYPKCKCAVDQSKNCTPSGLNQGIMPDETQVCKEREADLSGNVTETPKYSACTCKAEYKISADTCSADAKYNQTGQPYCYGSDDPKENNPEETVGIMYKACYCDGGTFDLNDAQSGSIPSDIKKTAEEYCKDKGKDGQNGVVNEKLSDDMYFCEPIGEGEGHYYPNRSLCLDGAPSGYNILEYGDFETLTDLKAALTEDGLKAKIKELCNHPNNATIVFDSNGNAYYKCTETANVAKGGTWYTQAECEALDQNSPSLLEVKGTGRLINPSWLQSVTVYPTCGCPDNFNQTVSCKDRQVPDLPTKLKNGVEVSFCFNKGNRQWSPDKGTSITGSSVSCDLITNGEVCINFDGTKKYDWTKCSCNASVYTVKGNTLNAICCNTKNCQNNSDRDCHFNYCVDSKGVYRNTNKHTGNSGGITVEIGHPTCSISGGKVTCK